MKRDLGFKQLPRFIFCGPLVAVLSAGVAGGDERPQRAPLAAVQSDGREFRLTADKTGVEAIDRASNAVLWKRTIAKCNRGGKRIDREILRGLTL